MAEKKEIQLPVVDVGDESISVDEALGKVAMYLSKTENPKILSEVNDTEIRLAAALYSIAERVKDDMLKNFLDNFLYLRVSNKRKGREELLKIAQSVREMPESRLARLRSFFGGGMSLR